MQVRHRITSSYCEIDLGEQTWELTASVDELFKHFKRIVQRVPANIR